MAFFNSAVTVLQTLVIALGAGLGIWGAINLLEGYGNDNPGAKSQGMKQRMPWRRHWRHWMRFLFIKTADGWRRRGTDRHDSGAAAFWSVRLSESCRSEDSDRAAKAACYIVRCRQSPQLAIFCALRQVHMLEV